MSSFFPIPHISSIKMDASGDFEIEIPSGFTFWEDKNGWASWITTGASQIDLGQNAERAPEGDSWKSIFPEMAFNTPEAEAIRIGTD